MSDGTLLQVIMVIAGALFATGLYGLIAKSHLIKMVMGLEFCGKGVCLLLIAGGYASGQTGLSQAVAITLIAIEAVVAGVALALAVVLKKSYRTLDTIAIFRRTGGGS